MHENEESEASHQILHLNEIKSAGNSKKRGTENLIRETPPKKAKEASIEKRQH